MKKSLTLLILILFHVSGLYAQTNLRQEEKDTVEIIQEQKLVQVKTRDGNIYVGKLISDSESEIVIETDALGKITLEHSNIKTIELIQQNDFKDGIYWGSTARNTRYFYSSNGYGLNKGDVFYQNTLVIHNKFVFSIGKHISLDLGVLPFLEGKATYFMAPKISYPIIKDQWNVALTTYYFSTITMVDKSSHLFIPYIVSTYGSRKNNVSIGYGMVRNGRSNTNLLTLSGIIKANKSIQFMAEGHFHFPEPYSNFLIFPIGVAGIRSHFKHISLDAGIGLIAVNIEGWVKVPYPWLGISVPLN